MGRRAQGCKHAAVVLYVRVCVLGMRVHGGCNRKRSGGHRDLSTCGWYDVRVRVCLCLW